MSYDEVIHASFFCLFWEKHDTTFHVVMYLKFMITILQKLFIVLILSRSNPTPQLMCLIGEVFEQYSEDVCGAVVQNRGKGDKVSIWTADCENKHSYSTIG